MPLLRCLGKGCQHEYESYDDKPKCGWCGSKSFYILQDKTPTPYGGCKVGNEPPRGGVKKNPKNFQEST